MHLSFSSFFHLCFSLFLLFHILHRAIVQWHRIHSCVVSRRNSVETHVDMSYVYVFVYISTVCLFALWTNRIITHFMHMYFTFQRTHVILYKSLGPGAGSGQFCVSMAEFFQLKTRVLLKSFFKMAGLPSRYGPGATCSYGAKPNTLNP